jgi:hypothetical protein
MARNANTLWRQIRKTAERLLQAQEHLPGMKSVIAAAAGAKADILVAHADKINFGKHYLEVL